MKFASSWILVSGATAESTIRLPTLSIDKSHVIAAGFDHSAEFAHQLHIAYSATFSGSCIFAGQPWNCNDHDHPYRCRTDPDDVDVGSLVDDPRRRCGQNPIGKTECVDPVEYFFNDRIFVFRGKHDDVYGPGVVENTVGLVAQMLAEPGDTMKVVLDQEFGHVLPLPSTPRVNSSEPGGYDGPGECLRFAFDTPLSAGSSKRANWKVFDQTEFAEAGIGFQDKGWIYVPEMCSDYHAQCKLVVRPDKCAPPTDFAADAGVFADYAEANGVVLLHPCVGGDVDEKKFPDATDVKKGKFDVHGELSQDYVEQSAPHMRAVGKMVRRVLGNSDAPSPAPPAGGVVLAEELTQSQARDPEATIAMPTLNIDRSGILTVGCSNDADFAHQFHVAFSSLVKGSCVFSGMPYHCAVTRFPGDYMVPKSPSTAANIHCPDCDANGTLIYDHCKNHPEWVDINVLAEYAETAKNVDDPREHLSDSRAFVFGPTHDRCYKPPAMANVAAFYWKYAKRSTQVRFVHDQPFPHTLPTNSTPYFNHSEPAGYDGPGHCLSHVFFHQKGMQPAVLDVDRQKYWKRVNATQFVPDPLGAGMRQSAWLFVPPQCEQGSCKLIIKPGGCDALTDDPPSGGDEDAFARYGFANGIVVLKPCQGGPIDLKRYPNNHENKRGMKDVYGQMTAEYATQKGSQMEPIGNMLKKLLGVSDASALV